MRDVLTVRTTHYLNEMLDVPASRDRARTPRPAAYCSPCNQAIEMACSSEETRISRTWLVTQMHQGLRGVGVGFRFPGEREKGNSATRPPETNKGNVLNCCGKMPSLRKAGLPGSFSLPKQLRMSPSPTRQKRATTLPENVFWSPVFFTRSPRTALMLRQEWSGSSAGSGGLKSWLRESRASSGAETVTQLVSVTSCFTVSSLISQRLSDAAYDG
jgi:hypothetical protein